VEQFDNNLMETLRKWKEEGHKIILLIDANEEVGAKPGGLNQAITTAGLINLISSKHDAQDFPNTYARGMKRINYIFGSENVRNHCKMSGILPFGFGYPSDHQAIFTRINFSSLLQTEVRQSQVLPDSYIWLPPRRGRSFYKS
jgi:hypothetical protein